MNEMKDKVMDKADALCSKLPLDKINQKLGGKFDVKSKKGRLIFGGAILAVIAIIVVIICAIFSSPSLSDDELAKAQMVAATRYGATGITDIEYAATIDNPMVGDVIFFNAKCMIDGKIENIRIAVVRNINEVDVSLGHYTPKE